MPAGSVAAASHHSGFSALVSHRAAVRPAPKQVMTRLQGVCATEWPATVCLLCMSFVLS